MRGEATLPSRGRAGCVLAALIGVIWISACGGSSDKSLPTDSRKAHLAVSSKALSGGLRIGGRFRCREDEVWLPLEWSRVPLRTAEVVVVIGLSPITRIEGTASASLANEVVIAGVDPTERRLRTGRLPDGVYILSHEAGPDCPLWSEETGVTFSVYALPSKHPISPSQSIKLSTIHGLSKEAIAAGMLPALYGEDM